MSQPNFPLSREFLMDYLGDIKACMVECFLGSQTIMGKAVEKCLKVTQTLVHQFLCNVRANRQDRNRSII